MSQEARNNGIALKPPAGETPNQPWAMDAAADRLMDDVFADVDLMLNSGGELPTEAPKQEYVTMQQIAIPRINVPPTMQPRPREAVASGAERAEKPQKSGNSFEKLLLVGACASLGITLLLWLTSQGRLNWLFGGNSTTTPVASQSASPADMQFMDYMQRSLDVIDQQSEERQESATPQTQQATNNAQIPVPFPGSLPAANNSPSVLERVYIPVSPRIQTVYVTPPAAPAPAARPPATAARPVIPTPVSRPTTTAARPAAPSPLARPTTAAARPAPSPAPRQTVAARPAPSPASRQTVAARPAPSPAPRQTVAARPAPSPASRQTVAAAPPAAPSPAPRQTAARPAASSPAPRQTVAAVRPAAPATTAPTNTTTPSVSQPRARSQQSTQATAPQIPVRLSGLLSAEDSSKSAALFEVNGVTRRIYAGESIGSSGWTLVEVSDREAVIRRNGDVRSVSVGEQF